MPLSFTAVAEIDPASLPDTIYPQTPMDLTITSEIKSTLASDRIIYRARCTVRTLADRIAWQALEPERSLLISGSRGRRSRPMGTYRYSPWGVDAL